MRANNQMMNSNGRGSEKISFSAAITGKSMQEMIMRSVKDSQAAARLTGTLISVVNSSQQLQQCEPTSIVSSALRGEGMGLILGHGYYIVPYGSIATFILGYKGYISLAMATGYYADIDCIEVREGEMKGINRRTGKPDIDFSTYETMEEREEHKIIGYYAYFELTNHVFRYEYMTVDKLLRHADHYSKAFSLEKYEQMVSGKMVPADIDKLKKGSPWYDIGGGQENMFRKTVLRRLLNSGYAPLSNEVRSIIGNDDDDGIIPADIHTRVDNSTGEVIETTGQVVEDAASVEEETSAESDFKAPVAAAEESNKKTRQSGKTKQDKPARVEEAASASFADGDTDDFTRSFFNM